MILFSIFYLIFYSFLFFTTVHVFGTEMAVLEMKQILNSVHSLPVYRLFLSLSPLVQCSAFVSCVVV